MAKKKRKKAINARARGQVNVVTIHVARINNSSNNNTNTVAAATRRVHHLWVWEKIVLCEYVLFGRLGGSHGFLDSEPAVREKDSDRASTSCGQKKKVLIHTYIYLCTRVPTYARCDDACNACVSLINCNVVIQYILILGPFVSAVCRPRAPTSGGAPFIFIKGPLPLPPYGQHNIIFDGVIFSPLFPFFFFFSFTVEFGTEETFVVLRIIYAR